MRRTLRSLFTLLLILSLGAACGSCGRRSQLPERESGHPILLVHADQGSPKERANDRSWLELIESTLGGCDVTGSARFVASSAADSLTNRIVIVFTHAALAELDTLGIGAVTAYVQQGGIAFLDTPEGPWAKAAGLRILFSKEHEQLDWPSQLSWQTNASISSPSEPTAPGLKAMPGSLPPLSLHFVQSGLRPVSYGLRSVGNPFGMSSIWWTSRGKGGFLTQSLCLPQLMRGLEKNSSLPAARKAQWRSAIVDALLSPDIFPVPFPRVWAQPFDGALASAQELQWRAFKREIHFLPSWQAPRTLELKMTVPGDEFEAAIAVPQRWRGRTLSDWTSSFARARSRRVREGGREWRLVSLPPGESTLSLRYRPARWR
jgi:hypothetical protein